MTSTRIRKLLVLVATLSGGSTMADDVRPVQVQLREQEPGLFLVRWEVPKWIPLPATPSPVLPDGCEPEGEGGLREQEATWIHEQSFRCEGMLAGRTLGIHYPFLNASVSTLFRVSLLSGDELARILAPGEDEWTLPEAAPDFLRLVSGGVLIGVEHVFDEWIHVALVVAFAISGAALTGWFALGQLGAVALSVAGVSIASNLSEIGVAIAVAVVARAAVRAPAGQERDLVGVAIACGLVHGLGLASWSPDAGALVLAIVGIDATLLVLVAVGAFVLARPTWRARAAYVTGGVAVALGLALLFRAPPARTETRPAGLPSLSAGSGEAGSRRIAPSAPDAPIQSFVAIEAFETRHEVLVRLANVWDGEADVVAVEDQPDVKERLSRTLAAAAAIAIDGSEREALVDRVDFVTIDAEGVLPRSAPVPELVSEASVGVTFLYVTPQTPESVTLTWRSFDLAPEIPTTMIDPESTRTTVLTADDADIVWTNALDEDPIPTVSAVHVEPRRLSVPLASIPILVVTLWAFATRRARVGRVALALTLVVAPLGAIAVALPASPAPSSGQARRILASLLPNVYRAFEFREEAAAYDRLAVSVTGDTLTEVYLEHRRALEMEERGGARARVEAVEVQAVEDVVPGEDRGFDAVALWTVGGTVTHFGHRHFRENRYQAAVTVVPVEGQWKIRAIEVLDEGRVR